MTLPTENEACVDAWCALDVRTAVLAADREAIATSRSVRSLIVDFARAGGNDEEIYDACAALGRVIAEHRGSGTLASSTIENAAAVLAGCDPSWLASGRAAVVEAFTAALVEEARQDALRSWEFPACVVWLPDGCIAIAAGFPSAEAEELSAWAARIARGAALRGVRRAFVAAGPAQARRAVEEALDVVGVAYEGSRT